MNDLKYCICSSEVKASKSQSSEGESEKKPEVTNKEPAKTTSQPTLEESSEYETETDEEGMKMLLNLKISVSRTTIANH